MDVVFATEVVILVQTEVNLVVKSRVSMELGYPTDLRTVAHWVVRHGDHTSWTISSPSTDCFCTTFHHRGVCFSFEWIVLPQSLNNSGVRFVTTMKLTYNECGRPRSRLFPCLWVDKVFFRRLFADWLRRADSECLSKKDLVCITFSVPLYCLLQTIDHVYLCLYFEARVLLFLKL